MSKRILLFSDGTGNSSAKAQTTNVWRLFQAIDLSGPEQIAFYDNGVGTSSNKYLAILGGVFGWGLKRNVIDLYKFVCRNYQGGDQISGFGFSRGAFTIRVLVGLITHEGLLNPMSEEELDRYARAAYRSYRAKRFPSRNPIVPLLRWLRDQYLHLYDWLRGFPSYTPNKNRQTSIHFLGLWDTVAAYAIPIDALKKAVNAVIWPMLFADFNLAKSVTRACQALSLDDERQTFHPLLWDETGEAQMVADQLVPPGRLTQVWFAGVHSNVGGGYPEDQLSYVPLHWIMSEAAAAGIQLLPAAVDKIATEKSPFARLYDSRAGFGAFYRYAPRQVPPFHDTHGQPIDPIIDGSVLLRMADGTDNYAPVTLPARLCVLNPSGTLQPMLNPSGALMPTLAPVPLASQAPQLAANTAQLSAACRRLTPPGVAVPDPQALQVVGDTVWWRRVMYLVQLLFAALLLLLPFYGSAVPSAGETNSAVLISDDAIHFAINAVKGLLPSITTRWTDAFGAHPDLFVLLSIGLLGSLYLSGTLKVRIADRVRMAWHANFRIRHLEWCEQSAHASRNTALFALLVAVVLLMLSLVANGASLTTLELGGVSLALGLLLVWRIYRLQVLKKINRQASTTLPTTFALGLAHRLRTSRLMACAYNSVANYVLPSVFIAVFLAFVAMVLNRAVFDASLATGKYCQGIQASDPSVFQTHDFCWPSGIQLEKDATYQIILTTKGDWFDSSERADVGGFQTDTPAHFSAMLLRRYWFQPWFRPIARIGAIGDDEYVLEPINPFTAHVYHNTMSKTEQHLLPISDAEAATAMQDDPTPDDRKTLVAKITARSSGELFLYVNDAVLAPPFDTQTFYPDNYGHARVTVNRLYPDGRVEPVAQP
ncbi:MAG: DUF2235 domain-containing protein [Pseudomonas sp.]